ncbi:MAG TPA: oligopeptide/dipeptide ABC transporter ATP-binding protein [Reyranella sp.]|nr:oligopeptide/dipeptide ABC transporter ATP-binding protein [Reyranella sp.]
MTALLEVSNLARSYDVRRGRWPFAKPATLHAVDGVSFALPAGRTLGLVGESGCGKTTTAKLVLGLVPLTAGEVRIGGERLPPAHSPDWRALRRRMQMVYQDPLGALDRRLSVGRQVMEPLVIHGLGNASERREKALAMLDAVGLTQHHFDRFPHELSGGQRQRIVLARALILDPQLLVCDEPISALDVSIQAQVVNLLLALQQKLGLAYLFISHDLRMVRQVSHEVAVMYLGRIVEQGDPDRLFATPAHPYTQALVSAIPTHTRGRKRRIVLPGEPPNPVDRPAGCAFHPRCPHAVARCRLETPALRTLADGRRAACHLAEQIA